MIQIGTRKSTLALWQANQVRDHLKKIGYASKLVAIESLGDKNLVQPIYSMGIKGVFTKSLDIALINNKIDIAIHSLKDVPTLLPKGIEISAYLKRDNPYDIVVHNPKFIDWDVYDRIFINGWSWITLTLSKITGYADYNWLDQKIIDGTGHLSNFVSKKLKSTQSGVIQNYLLSGTIGLIIVFIIFQNL